MNSALNFYNRLFLLWVALGGAAAYLFPGVFTPLKGGMDWFFAVTMLGVGMVFDPGDFLRIFKNLRVVLIGVTAQFTIMPMLAWLIARSFAFSEQFKLGLILTGSAPGAMASNVLSYLAGADVAYSVSLTTVSTTLSPLLTPLLTLTLASAILDVPFWGLFLSVCKMVVLPLFLGFLLKRAAGERLRSAMRVFPALSTTFIVFICALVIALNRNYVAKLDSAIFAAALLLNLAGLSLGYLVGRISGFDLKRRRALAIEIGMQNAGLGSVLALRHFDERVALPAVIFVFVCIFTASALVPLWARQGEHSEGGAG